MSAPELAAVAAATITTLGFAADISDRARKARNESEDANDKADEALDSIAALADSGPVVRGSAPSVADLEVGLSYPQQSAQPTSGPFSQTATPPTRPVISESDATDVEAYPGRVSAYTKNGLLRNPTEAVGQNVLVGKLLRYVEIRAFFAGLALNTSNGANPPGSVLQQFYRFGQGVARAISEVVTSSAPDGLSQDSYTDAIRRLLSGSVSGSRKIAQLLKLNGELGTGLAAETVVFSLSVPKFTLIKDGDRLVIDSGGVQNGQAGGDQTTVSIRQGNAAGALIATTTSNNAPAGRAHVQRATLTRVGPNQVRVSGFGAFSGAGVNSTDSLLTWDFTQDQAIAWTVLHGSNNAGNVTQIDNAAIYLQT